MKQKELTKTFMMISNLKKKHFDFHDLYKHICFLRGRVMVNGGI